MTSTLKISGVLMNPPIVNLRVHLRLNQHYQNPFELALDKGRYVHDVEGFDSFVTNGITQCNENCRTPVETPLPIRILFQLRDVLSNLGRASSIMNHHTLSALLECIGVLRARYAAPIQYMYGTVRSFIKGYRVSRVSFSDKTWVLERCLDIQLYRFTRRPHQPLRSHKAK